MVKETKDLYCTQCVKPVPPDKNGCSCGMSREQIKREAKTLNWDVNRMMFPDMPEMLLDRPWGNK